MATLRDFYENLGSSMRIEGEVSLADSGAATDATVAMARIVRQYVDLSTYGEKLRQMLVVGIKVPCEVWQAYATARQDYLNKSQAVFDQLAQKGITVEQVVYSAGRPKPDPNDPSKTFTVQVQAPLRPPAFAGLSCPGLPLMSGASFRGGWQPVPIEGNTLMLGSVSNSAVAEVAGGLAAAVVVLMSGGTALGLAGYSAAKTYKLVSVFVEAFDASPIRILNAYTSCVESGTKAGLAPTDAANRCSSVQQTAQQYGLTKAQIQAEVDKARAAGLGFWGWLGVGAGVVILGSIVLRYMRSRAGAAMRVLSPVPVGDFDPPLPPLDGVPLGELYFRPRRRRRGRR